MWVGDGSQTASRRDIHSGATLARVRLTGTRNGPGAMAMANGVVWAGEEAFVDRIDAHHARVLRPAQAGPTPLMSVYAWGSDVWVGNWNWGQMRRLDARTGRLRGVYRFGGAGMAEDGHELWTTTALTTRSRRGDDPILTRLDLRSDRVTGRYRVGRRATPTSLNFCGAVRDYYEACPNPRPGIQALSLGAVAVADGSLWLAQNVERRIYRLRLAP